MSGNLTSNRCVPCEIGYYGSGGEIINNWRDWTNNGTVPPMGSDIVTFCEKSRDYVKDCQSWTASGKRNKIKLMVVVVVAAAEAVVHAFVWSIEFIVVLVGSLESMKVAEELLQMIAEVNSSFLIVLQTSQVHHNEIVHS